jgi:hypothetical protein
MFFETFISWWHVLLYPLPLIVIPLAVGLGRFVRGGALTILSVVALLAFGAFWFGMRDYYTPTAPFGYSPSTLIVMFAVIAGAPLLLCAWTVALVQAARRRQWVWLTLLCVAVYISAATLVFFEATPYALCLLDPGAFCPQGIQSGQSTLAIFMASSFIAPVTLLVYSLRTGTQRQARALPDGLRVTRLTTEES